MSCALLAASWSSSALSKNQPNAIANELHHGPSRSMISGAGIKNVQSISTSADAERFIPSRRFDLQRRGLLSNP